MKTRNTKKILNLLIASIWIISGLFCKVLNLVPRHQLIVVRIIGPDLAPQLTILIGLLEVGMGIWIISRLWPRLNTIIQLMVIAVMNILEFILAPDLLLWGRINIVFAFLFMLLIFYNEFRPAVKLN